MSERLDRIEKNMEELFRGIRELREFQKETSQQIRELREFQMQTEKEIRELRESQKETENFLKEVMRGIRELRIQLGDIGLVQGEIGEELFYRNLKSMFKKRGMVFNSVRRNLRKSRDDREYDIVATNGTQVLVVEVKNKLRRRHIDQFLEERLPEFKEKFPQYKDKELLGAVGGLVVKDDVARYAERKGLFVLTQTDDGGATILNKERFKPKVFG